jgi:hypothetical protein
MSILIALQNWYKDNCNGDWEHSYGVKIDTLDNPGWSVKIDLIDTDWEGSVFDSVQIQRENEDDWIFCKVEDKSFIGCGGPDNLAEILEIFIAWVNK